MIGKDTISKLAGQKAIALFLLMVGLVALKAQPVTAEDYLEVAREHFSRRRFLNTLDTLRIVFELTEDASESPQRLAAEILAAQSLAALQQREQAANMFVRALAHGYKDKAALAYVGLYYADRRQYAEARNYLARYFALDRTDTPTHIRYAVVLSHLGEKKQAREILESIEPLRVQKREEECLALERKKQFQASYKCFQEYRDGYPDRTAGYLGLYRIARAMRDLALARSAAEDLYWLFGSEQPRFIWPLIEVRLEERRFYDARLLLEEVIQKQGKNADAERLLANLKNAIPQALEKPGGATSAEMRMLGEHWPPRNLR
ncbi:MAG: tetratricopeptide repeat protein [Turneriella sp.]|nr:tetratricopeptide repeat protein [Turneriella sp.]